jgi:peptidoglycan/LPS O-acetylase OafA/YrhL
MLQCSALNGFIVLVRQRRFRRLNTAMYAEPHANLPETKHVDYLDGWRGGAILLLLVGHFAALPTISGHSFYTGRLGVECFFVLSGRLMAEILFLRQIPIGIFYWRRISRIFPALWLFLGALTFATVLYPQIDVTSLKALASVAFLVNYLPEYSGNSLGHIWSLCVEEHAYIFLSLIAIIHRQWKINVPLILALVSIICVLNGAIQTWIGRDYYQVYLHSDVRAASIFMSSALYLALKDFKPVGRAFGAVPLLAIGSGFAVSMLYAMPDTIKYSVGTFLIALGLATLQWCWEPAKRFLSSSAMTYLGLWSFSLYLWQQPFSMLLGEINSLVAVSLLFAVSLTSYYLVEKPARKLLNSWAGATLIKPQQQRNC